MFLTWYTPLYPHSSIITDTSPVDILSDKRIFVKSLDNIDVHVTGDQTDLAAIEDLAKSSDRVFHPRNAFVFN